MRTPEQAIRNFMDFCNNYPYDFIEKCWLHWSDTTIIPHLKEKFSMYYKHYGAMGVMQGFWGALSEHHQIKLSKWIDENYNEIKAVPDQVHYKVVDAKQAKKDQLSPKDELGNILQGFAYTRGEAIKKAKAFDGRIEKIPAEELENYWY